MPEGITIDDCRAMAKAVLGAYEEDDAKMPVDVAFSIMHEAFECLDAGGSITRRWDYLDEGRRKRRVISLNFPPDKEV